MGLFFKALFLAGKNIGGIALSDFQASANGDAVAE
jgi:hypothetical protein